MNAAVGVHRDLLFEHQLAIDASRAAAVQRLIQHGCCVPLRSEPPRRRVSDGDSRQRPELFLHLASAFADLRRFVDIRRSRLRPRRNACKMALRQLETLVGVHIAEDQQDSIGRRVVCLKEFLDVIERRSVEIVEIAVEIVRIGPVAIRDGGKIEPWESAVGLIQHVDAHFLFHHVALIAQVLVIHFERAHAVGLKPQHAVQRVRRDRLVIVRDVIMRRAVQYAAGGIDRLDMRHLPGIGRALKHHVLEQVREAALAARLDAEANVVIDTHSSDRRGTVRRHHHA